MNTATAQKAHASDLAGQIVYALRSMGVAPIPRNYQLFYEAYIGSNAQLSRDLVALGTRATQEELDHLADEYLGRPQAVVIERAHTRLAMELEGVLRVIRQEQNSLESYNRLLEETASRINTKTHFSADLLANAIDLLTSATGDTMAHGEKTVENVVQRSQEMDDVRKELDEYKRIANTDSLTRLANRRAFDEKLASLYDDQMSLAVTALVLVDIDHFKRINDTYGHPVGDKILATVASVIRSNVRKDVFVARTGGEEFAMIIQGNTPEEVLANCERVRRALESRPFRNSRTGVDYGPVTISLGFSMAIQAEDPGQLYEQADVALYCAKGNGRNRSQIFEDGMRKDYLGKGWLIYKK